MNAVAKSTWKKPEGVRRSQSATACGGDEWQVAGFFTEPQGWALKWHGFALPEPGDNARGEPEAFEGWTLGREGPALLASETPMSENGTGLDTFAQPRGWALQWDGAALLQIDGSAD
jgi:hypothetical protein